MNIYTNSQNAQRGEVAWLLTVISMVVIATGLVIGFNVSTQEQAAVRVAPQAAGFNITPIQQKAPGDLIVIGGEPRVLEQTGMTPDGTPIKKTDGYFKATGGECKVDFSTDTVDPLIYDLVIGRPTSKDYPNHDETFSLIDNAINISTGKADLKGMPILKGKSVVVRFKPGDSELSKYGKNPDDIVVKYIVSATESSNKIYVVDSKKVNIPSWVRSQDTDITLAFTYEKADVAKAIFFMSGISTPCSPTGTPTPSVGTPTPPSGTPTPSKITPTPPTGTPTVSVGPSKTPTPTLRVTGIPTRTVTPITLLTPTKLSCDYNALAIVEECLKVDATGHCIQYGDSVRYDAKPFQNSTLDPNPNDTDRSNKWGTANNRQRDNSATPPRPEAMRPATIMREYTAQEFNLMASVHNIFYQLKGFASNLRDGNFSGISGFWEQSHQEVTPKSGNPIELITATDAVEGPIKIESDAEVIKHVKVSPIPQMYQNEQYPNRSEASVKLYYDEQKYGILPVGAKMYSCTNDLANKYPSNDPSIQKMRTGLGACNAQAYQEFENKQKDPKTALTVDKSIIPGFVVGCGQNIVYGWTLHKCSFDFDYVFVLDNSTTMNDGRDPKAGNKFKIDAAKDAIKEFMDKIASDNSRMSLVTFNSGHAYYTQIGKDAKDPNSWRFAAPNKGNGIVTPTFMTPKEFNDANIFGRLSQTHPKHEGSCIECGLADAQNLIKSRTDSSRPVVVIALTDGLTNSYEYASGHSVIPMGWQQVYKVSDDLRADGWVTQSNENLAGFRGRTFTDNKNTADDVLLITLGYGDASIVRDPNPKNIKTDANDQEIKKYQDFPNLKAMASDLTNGDRWAWSTEKANNPDGRDLSVSEIFDKVHGAVNSCKNITKAFASLQKAKDVNADGIVNTLDLFLVFDNYYAKGENLKEDINSDGVVNINDVTLVIESLGTVVTPADSAGLTAPESSSAAQ